MAGPKLVFTRTGTPADTSNILHRFQWILKDPGLPKMRFYDLRHTHTSVLIAEGVHPKKIARAMDLYGRRFNGSEHYLLLSQRLW